MKQAQEISLEDINENIEAVAKQNSAKVLAKA